jgi:multiple sugar transport system permease protein
VTSNPLTDVTASAAGRRPGKPARRRSGGEAVGSSRAWRLSRRALAVVLGLLFVAPVYWVFVISVARPGEFDSFPPVLLPHWDWHNWSRAWSEEPWVRLFGNTILIACCTTALALITSVLAGFAFGVLRFPGRKTLTLLVLSVLMMPTTVLIIPDYILASDLHLINTYWIQIIPFGASVFGIFLVRQFFLGMPQELLDAASLDGAGRLRVLWYIGVPMVRPALVIIAINSFMGSWNSFLWPEIMTGGNPSVQPIEVGVATFSATDGTDYSGLAAAVTFTTLPVMIFFLVLQRQFIRGALSAAGSLK